MPCNYIAVQGARIVDVSALLDDETVNQVLSVWLQSKTLQDRGRVRWRQGQLEYIGSLRSSAAVEEILREARSIVEAVASLMRQRRIVEAMTKKRWVTKTERAPNGTLTVTMDMGV